MNTNHLMFCYTLLTFYEPLSTCKTYNPLYDHERTNAPICNVKTLSQNFHWKEHKIFGSNCFKIYAPIFTMLISPIIYILRTPWLLLYSLLQNIILNIDFLSPTRDRPPSIHIISLRFTAVLSFFRTLYNKMHNPHVSIKSNSSCSIIWVAFVTLLKRPYFATNYH